MSKYITKRVLVSLGTLIVILFVLFLMLDKMPGSPFNDEKLTEAQKALLYAKYGLDQPFFVRFVKYFTAMLRGDLGVSYVIRYGCPSGSAQERCCWVRFSVFCWESLRR